MNPFKRKVAMNGSAGRAYQHSRKRRHRIHRKGKFREVIGVLDRKESLDISLLNVDGLSELSFLSVEETVAQKNPDMVILLETKRRVEELSQDISMEGYDLIERRRSDGAGDRAGGGLAVFTKRFSNIFFKEHRPKIDNPAHAFVNNERVWMKCESTGRKTAVCGLYLGFQAPDDRHAHWNDILYDVLRAEIRDLQQAGFRILLKGDFNGHVGAAVEDGIVGNHLVKNRNGVRFLQFLDDVNACHLNGACRVAGDWETRISKGLWTRQRGGISSVIDYGVVLLEDLASVKSFEVDDQGRHPTGSDHNWIFTSLEDSFVTKRTVLNNGSAKKHTWDFGEGFDWSKFAETVGHLVDETPYERMHLTPHSQKAAQILLSSASTNIGVRDPRKKSKRSTLLPRDVVNEITIRKGLEADWKAKSSALAAQGIFARSIVDIAAVTEAERLLSEQTIVVQSLLSCRRHIRRDKVLKDCQGHSIQARKCFWSYVSPSCKQSSGLECVFSPSKKVMDDESIKSEVESHLVEVFRGSLDPVVKDDHNSSVYQDHSYSELDAELPFHDHTYSQNPSPTLPRGDATGNIKTDPKGWLDKKFLVSEVTNNIKKLKKSKAKGLDGIPNEFIKFAGHKFHVFLTSLFNKIKESGQFPDGWNKGRICLVFKKGEREKLGNYRPLTVIISLSGLYSRVLNDRLTQVVECHTLLGEIQQGFRKGRMGSDNAFILNTIFWKSKLLLGYWRFFSGLLTMLRLSCMSSKYRVASSSSFIECSYITMVNI